ncbi:2-polyprenyl-3-methyl-6-methoxy-1,4-benzoquinone monooxygenase [Dyella mobilis]|uniref:3-demethoxyubiquinol 3-hydroxylase n=1 Tax=Dyella mobilis TaxID=1849582 RepID=A0ABS2KGA7_9GAMM|nr:2-polyprenyl-3-methyl-6-methoxy-1,4-benzoquinone monooxygenase [Dyella mobilis]MBM7130192.1 2-polyprenyl-3-methyl-6-methoxy-1,4-benzoquinone monooxygenase [Dyella mobilis]GLQ96818.1 2-nonaprenyl-3-methyl-6-methoxy-1,4-benzoquinol hydroxylase [Dyella mobilis]
MNVRTLTPLDRLLAGIERALETVAGSPEAHRASPSHGLADAELDDAERRHAAGLMRINHTGEVCAQALYDGQAALARKEENRAHLQHAAAEETDHLAWCSERLRELESRPSLLNPLWYAGSYAIGAAAALAGDRISLGFVVETEKQVEAHLADHLDRLPTQDERSRAVLKQMQADEVQHAQAAREHGGIALPFPIPQLMHVSSMVMKTVAYRL